MALRRLGAKRPPVSLVLTSYLEQCNEPPWTSFFIKFSDITNDHRGRSHYNFTLKSGANYHILRTGCFPFAKYHCTRRGLEDLSFDDRFYRVIKIINLGIPQLMYGIAAIFLIRYTEQVVVKGWPKPVPIYFLYKEDKGSKY